MAQEHLIIQGGEQWLPFARSRIKALRATGVLYASQKFDVEGTTVRVRVEPDHDYIDISGGVGAWIHMDSGVIDLKTVFPRNLLRYKPGVFVDTTKTLTYKAPFTEIKKGWKFNTGGSNESQLAGDIRGDKKTLEGRVPVDPQPPASFAPFATKDEDGSLTYKLEDDYLANKKLRAAIYPAGCFTGRMRAYVQAMMGQPLYHPGGGENDLTSTAVSWSGVVPGVVIPYAEEKYLDTLPRRNVDANCSSGVIKTKEGAHWLVNIGSDTMWFFPLKGSGAAERLRKFIGDTSALPDHAKEKLECYILASSRPVASKMVIVPLGGNYPGLSMGYGWHWNWSGTKANIVVNNEFEQGVTVPGGGPGIGLRSHHLEMRVSPKYSGGVVDGWEVSIIDVEGVKEWGVDRQIWNVAFPSWGSPYLDQIPLQEKLFPRWSVLTDSTTDAPFYVFYNRDDLVLCRAKISKIAGRREFTGSSVLNTYGPGPANALTEGDRGGFRKYVDANSHYTAEFTVGTSKYKACPYGYAANGIQEVTSGVSRISGEPNYWGITFAIPAYIDYTVGYPSAYEIERRYAPPDKSGLSSFGNASPIYKLALTFTRSDVYDSYTGKTDILIPFNDAEAIYVSNKSTRQSYLTGQIRDSCTSELHGEWTTWWPVLPPAGDLNSYPHENFLRFVWASSSGDTVLSSGAIPNEDTFAVEDNTQELFSRGVKTSVVIDGGTLAQCQTPALPASTVIFPAQSGISVDSPVVLSMFFQDGKNLGISDTPLDTPVIVGWA